MFAAPESRSQRDLPSRGSLTVRINFGDQVIQIFSFLPVTKNAHDGMTCILGSGIQRFKAPQIFYTHQSRNRLTVFQHNQALIARRDALQTLQ